MFSEHKNNIYICCVEQIIYEKYFSKGFSVIIAEQIKEIGLYEGLLKKFNNFL